MLMYLWQSESKFPVVYICLHRPLTDVHYVSKQKIYSQLMNVFYSNFNSYKVEHVIEPGAFEFML